MLVRLLQPSESQLLFHAFHMQDKIRRTRSVEIMLLIPKGSFMQNFVALSNDLVTGLVQMKTHTVNFH